MFDQDPDRQQHGGDREAAQHDWVVPTREAAARDGEHERRQPDDERRGAAEIEAANGVRLGQLAQHERAPGSAGESERHVEPEHPVPGDADQSAAENGTQDKPDRRDHRVRAHRDTELFARKGVGDERRRVGEQERRADPLEDPPEDQLIPVGGETGAQRGRREQDEAADVGVLAAEQIRHPPGGEHQHGRGDHVGEDHPDQRQQARVEAALERGQGDDQRARVGRREEHAEARARQRPPAIAGRGGVDADAMSESDGWLCVGVHRPLQATRSLR